LLDLHANLFDQRLYDRHFVHAAFTPTQSTVAPWTAAMSTGRPPDFREME